MNVVYMVNWYCWQTFSKTELELCVRAQIKLIKSRKLGSNQKRKNYRNFHTFFTVDIRYHIRISDFLSAYHCNKVGEEQIMKM